MSRFSPFYPTSYSNTVIDTKLYPDNQLKRKHQGYRQWSLPVPVYLNDICLSFLCSLSFIIQLVGCRTTTIYHL